MFADITSKDGFSLSCYSFTWRKDCSDLTAQYILMDFVDHKVYLTIKCLESSSVQTDYSTPTELKNK